MTNFLHFSLSHMTSYTQVWGESFAKVSNNKLYELFY